MATYRKRPALEWFEKKVNKHTASGCHLWTAQLDRNGYGLFRQHVAHRFAWRAYNNEEIPADKEILHTCHVRNCVNPDHLRLGTHAENMREMVEQGNSTKGEKNPSAKLTEEQVREIKGALSKGHRRRMLAKKYGVSITQLGSIARGETWAWVK
tara:strand:- start:25 stop:486 length:462 start_codon:yes stop_codon:yes gene_type:complete